ncbi:hypothetical protein [Rivibacter subsaxonicus]|uniref:Uncharacterized protein n=1 Tax=Rivibacter subsaxonicus TaxID=457575 RepID=A0A4Q7V9E2_9BURK|nr:hypothetical protein [Rivibacter subsaxonicus]RZT92484.1 hypothetical protein EV670_3458 [Rivibacter subsaxonicus]
MPLLGSAAMLLSFDVAPEAIAEHDDWHTHEHLAERLSIPGFLRGTRWVALRDQPRYFVLYEVAELATLTSAAYLERLNSPSAWTSKMMPHYRGMSRGFCSVSGSFGLGMGHVAALLRFGVEPGSAASLRDWLLRDVLPDLPNRPGLGSVHLLEGAVTPSMTAEQSIRGADAGVDWALVLAGYSEEALAGLVREVVGPAHLAQHGATGVVVAMYRIDYSLTRGEVEV